MTRHWRTVGAVTTLVFLAPPGAASGAAVTPSPCTTFAVSPSFAADGTAFCAVILNAGPVLWRTTDRGRSWSRFALSPGVLPTETRTALYQVAVSPLYATDHAVYLHTSSGVYVTTDPADGLRPADPFATTNAIGTWNLSPYVDATAGVVSQGERVVFAYAAQDQAARIDPPLHSQAPAAAPNHALRFLVPRRVTADRTPVLVGLHLNGGGAGDHRVATYACSIALTCATEMHVFPAGDFRGAWLSPSFDTDGVVYVATSTGKNYSLFRSADRGRTFARWTAGDKVLAPVNAAMQRGDADTHFPPTLAIDQANPRTMFLRIAMRLGTARLPAQQVFRSVNGGATWSRITVPWDGPAGMVSVRANQNDMTVVGGRVFALASSSRDGYSGVFCSTDSGRTWGRACRG